MEDSRDANDIDGLKETLFWVLIVILLTVSTVTIVWAVGVLL